ncbi:MbcA/ParS/Xre antitoxin family protein [Asticcacaulis sp.]|uniref:MbcA/ParS/Xre antitoxin family protein n=1 Tax=Asticcacaulis sp. TaxID=1872648 RepID=UPI0031D8494B
MFAAATVDQSNLSPEALRSPEDRKRMSATALRLFFRTADLWALTVDQRRAILGDVSRATEHKWRNGEQTTLTRDQMERISLVLGILKGLRLVFAEDANGFRWLKASNSDFPFAGRSPLDHMTNGGINDLYAVRRYLDAWRGVK